MTPTAKLLQRRHEPIRPARLISDEQQVRNWFDCLSDTDRQRSYTLAEIRWAVSVPATRLRVVLFRLGWKPLRQPGFGVSTYYKPRRSLWPSDVADADRIIGNLYSPT